MSGRGGAGASLSTSDRNWLSRAAELAERGWGRVHPNPMVGCVLVKAGRVVGEGWHRQYGGAHAEVEAVKAAGRHARGATAYVSLEPCNHQGKTPPCAHLLIEAGIVRVVFGASDPKAGACGSLRNIVDDDRLNHRVELIGGVMAETCSEMLRTFFKDKRKK